MQNSLFQLEPTATAPVAACPHPPEAQIITGNLFTGKRDLVCAKCNATLAPDFQADEAAR